MVSTNYLHEQQIVGQLNLRDQARLLEYLSFRLAQAVALREPETTPAHVTPATAWQEFFRVGDDLRRTDRPDMETLTTTVIEMRR